MEKVVKVKNVSRKNFLLNLHFVTPNKILNLNPETVVPLSLDEYTYLITQCKGSFEKGKLQVVEIDKELEVEEIKSQNVMSFIDIDELLSLTNVKFKNKLSEITTVSLLKDIRQKSVEANKNDKFIDMIDNRIGEISDGSVLL